MMVCFYINFGEKKHGYSICKIQEVGSFVALISRSVCLPLVVGKLLIILEGIYCTINHLEIKVLSQALFYPSW